MTDQFHLVSRRHSRAAALAIALPMLAGCADEPVVPTEVPSATAISADRATPKYWLDQPGVETVPAQSFEQLWTACDDAARAYLFHIDRRDWREGTLVTQPLISRQWFELWRRDVPTLSGLADSSLATMRRTAYFHIDHRPNGSYVMTPKVLIEREAVAGRRVTTAIEYTSVFGSGGLQPTGTPESDVGVVLPAQYWYAVGRDETLERKLADSVRDRLR